MAAILTPDEAIEQLDRILELDVEIEDETRKLEKATAVRKMHAEIVKQLQATRAKLSHEIRHPEERPLFNEPDDGEDEAEFEAEAETEAEDDEIPSIVVEEHPPETTGEYDLNVPIAAEHLPEIPTGANGEARPRKARKPRKKKSDFDTHAEFDPIPDDVA
jgi:hypothetical protein